MNASMLLRRSTEIDSQKTISHRVKICLFILLFIMFNAARIRIKAEKYYTNSHTHFTRVRRPPTYTRIICYYAVNIIDFETHQGVPVLTHVIWKHE